jgi:hypothetical protein
MDSCHMLAHCERKSEGRPEISHVVKIRILSGERASQIKLGSNWTRSGGPPSQSYK